MTEQYSAVPTQDPDLMLIRAMAAGNTHALDSLYARYGPPVLSFLVARLGDRQLAEEILQDVMLAAWNSAATFRGESRVYTWLLVIARNRAMNAQRRHTPASVPLDEELGDYNGDSGLFEGLARKVTRTAVRDAVNNLSTQQREILVLVFYNQLSGPEVAHVLGITAGTVKSRLHRAKSALRKVLQAQGSV